MTDSDSDQQGEPRGIQIGDLYLGPIEYRFLKLVVYAVIGLFLWPYLLLLYIYIAARRLNKQVITFTKQASDRLRDEYETGHKKGCLDE